MIEGQRVTFDNGSVVGFDFPVKEKIEFEDKVIVLLKIGNSQYNQNVFAINKAGMILWQIEKSEDLDLMGYCPFVNIEMRQGQLILWNWCGFRLTADIDTGKIIDSVFTK